MEVYRITKEMYSKNMEGLGSKLRGGRWNNIGTPCIYTSQSRALAILEYAVNIGLDAIPRNLSILVFNVPEDEFRSFHTSKLPGDWQYDPIPQSTRDFGSNAFLEKELLGIKIPSIIIPEEFNYLINPLSSKIASLEVSEGKDFSFDVRIKK